MVMLLLRFVSFEGHRIFWTAGGFVGPFICPSIGFSSALWDRPVGPALILLLLPDLSVSHDSIPQELRAVSTGAQETQIW